MNNLGKKNKRTALVILAVVAAMVGLSFAFVPLYRLFCEMTGFAGTPAIGKDAPEKTLARKITISFDGRVDPGLPWDFRPEKRRITVHVGQQGLISYRGKNLSARATTGTAVYNVTPDKAGKYFTKTQCFCFAEQSLGPGKTAHFPVVFYVDPTIAKDREMDDVTDITLSYTFFPANSKALDDALSAYGARQ
jgi:cytochrome c oxidase assembly protein subunit 11